MGTTMPKTTTYVSSRGGTRDVSFETAVIKGLADDGGLFLPQQIPSIFSTWPDEWINWSFQQIAFQIFSQFISTEEIPSIDLQRLINQTYSAEIFRVPHITPTIPLEPSHKLYLLELFHGPTFAFKDVALQFVGNLFEYFLGRRNAGRSKESREHLTVIGATSGDTGSAAIYGLRNRKDVSIMIMFPEGRISPIQEAQMTSILDENVHNIAVDGTFDDCQDFVKAMFGDSEIKKTHQLAAINSINWARILAQITYYFVAYASLLREGNIRHNEAVNFVVPTGNFGDVLAGFFAKRMGLPIDKLIIATNENDILDRFWKSGSYAKKVATGSAAKGGFREDGVKAHEDGVKETLSPAMDILVSSNFERLLWYLTYETCPDRDADVRTQKASSKVKVWLDELKHQGRFEVDAEVLEAARAEFSSQRVSDDETLRSIANTFESTKTGGIFKSATCPAATLSSHGYVLDPHSAIGVAAARRSLQNVPSISHISLLTAHPAKFSRAVQEALASHKDFTFADIVPQQFQGLENLPRRKALIKKADGIEAIRKEIRARVPSLQINRASA